MDTTSSLALAEPQHTDIDDLATIKSKVTSHYTQFTQHAEAARHHAFAAGLLLLRARAHLSENGQWDRWVSEELHPHIPRRTVYRWVTWTERVLLHVQTQIQPTPNVQVSIDSRTASLACDGVRVPIESVLWADSADALPQPIHAVGRCIERTYTSAPLRAAGQEVVLGEREPVAAERAAVGEHLGGRGTRPPRATHAVRSLRVAGTHLARIGDPRRAKAAIRDGLRGWPEWALASLREVAAELCRH